MNFEKKIKDGRGTAMKKICMFSANYLPHMGGVENYTYHLSKKLVELGNKVTVVTTELSGCPTHEKKDGIEIFRMPSISLLNGRYPVCKVNKRFKKINRILKLKHFDFIIIHARFYFHSLYAARFAQKCHIPCIVIEHGSSHLSVNNKCLDFLGQIWEHFFTGILKHYCKDYYGVSKVACEWSGHFGIRSKGVLYNAVDLNAIHKILENPVVSYRKQYGINEKDKIIAFTGRLIPEKGISQLLDSFEEMSDNNTWLVVAGDGPLLNSMQIRKIPRTIFLGRIDFEHVISLLGETDIYCLPSVSEAMPTAVLEAIATKTFVITTKRGGAVEIIRSDDYGIIIDSNSIEDISHALERALSDDEYRQSCVENSYRKLIANITWDKTAQKVMEIITRDKDENIDYYSCI